MHPTGEGCWERKLFKKNFGGGEAGISSNHNNFYLGGGGDPRDICISSFGDIQIQLGKENHDVVFLHVQNVSG